MYPYIYFRPRPDKVKQKERQEAKKALIQRLAQAAYAKMEQNGNQTHQTPS